MDFEVKDKYNIGDLLRIMEILRSPDGCPWDREQDHQSIKHNFIEETYEAVEAINKNDPDMLCEELGDVLLQIVFHARMKEEEGVFSFDDVVDGICKKLVLRHPHIFADVHVKDAEEVLINWEEIKRKSKKQETATDAMMAVPKEFPALMRSAKVQKRAADIGFDWENVDGAFLKLHEETEELSEAIKKGDKKQIHEELGDLLFSVVNVSRFLKVDAETALADSTEKFLKRFALMEQNAKEENIDISTLDISALDELWNKAKKSQE